MNFLNGTCPQQEKEEQRGDAGGGRERGSGAGRWWPGESSEVCCVLGLTLWATGVVTGDVNHLMAVVRALKARLRALEEDTASQEATESGFHATAVNKLNDMERERVRVRRQESDVVNFLKTPGPMGPVGLPGLAGMAGADGGMGYPGHMGLQGAEGLEGPEGREGREGRMGATGSMGELLRHHVREIAVASAFVPRLPACSSGGRLRCFASCGR